MRCERLPRIHLDPATHIMERVECPYCGFRQVINVCDVCVKWAEDVNRRQARIVCQGCDKTKPSDPVYPIRILGKV
jgi:uncharacterized Zn-finger protein